MTHLLALTQRMGRRDWRWIVHLSDRLVVKRRRQSGSGNRHFVFYDFDTSQLRHAYLFHVMLFAKCLVVLALILLILQFRVQMLIRIIGSDNLLIRGTSAYRSTFESAMLVLLIQIFGCLNVILLTARKRLQLLYIDLLYNLVANLLLWGFESQVIDEF